MLRKLKRDDMIFILVMLLFTVGYYPFVEENILHDYSYDDCISLPAKEAFDIVDDLKEVEAVGVDEENICIRFDFTSDEYNLMGLPCRPLNGFEKLLQYIIVTCLYVIVFSILCWIFFGCVKEV